jgi:hypothetical protein
VTDTFDDDVEDTPYQTTPDFGDIWSKSTSWPSSTKDGYKYYHNICNYLNYVDDQSMFMFTRGQCKKMRDAINTVRRPWVLTDSQSSWLKSGTPYPLSHHHHENHDDDDNDRERRIKMSTVGSTIVVSPPLLDTDPFMYRLSKKQLTTHSHGSARTSATTNREGRLADFLQDVSGMCMQTFQKARAVAIVASTAIESLLPSSF